MKIAIRIVAFIGLFIVLNWFYERTELDRFLDAEANQVLQVRKITTCDVIYVSESSNFSPEVARDTDRRKLSQFIADFYPALQFEAINLPASHAGIYRQLLSIFPENNEVKTVVVAVNLRSFGAAWINSELETPLNKSAVMYNHRPPLLNRFLVGLNAYDNLSPAEREQEMLRQWREDPLPLPAPRNTVANWTTMEKWGDWRDPKRQLADHFIKQYACVVTEKNPRIADMDEIVETAKSYGWNLVFHLLAEDVEKTNELVGQELVKLMRANARWIESRYAQKGVLVVNNLEALSSEHFAEKDFPSEHYTEAGRKKLAVNIALALRALHQPHFVNPKWNTNP